MSDRRIWKFDLIVDDAVVIGMPKGSILLHAAQQNPANIDVIQIWAECDTTATTKPRIIYVRGTGHPMGDAVGMPYIGTVVTAGGKLIWHLFDGGETDSI